MEGTGAPIGRVRVLGTPSASQSSSSIPRIELGPRVGLLQGGDPGIAVALEAIIPSIDVEEITPDGPLNDLHVLVADGGIGGPADLARIRDLVHRSGRTPIVLLLHCDDVEIERLRPGLRRDGVFDTLSFEDMGLNDIRAVIDHASEVGSLRSELADMRERFALAIRAANDGMWEWDLRTGRVFYSQRWRELLGVESVDESIDAWFSRVHPLDLQGLRANIDEHVAGRRPLHDHEHRIRSHDGEWLWVLSHGVAQRLGDGTCTRLAGSLSDISRYRERIQDVHVQSRHDAVTNLPRREVFMERVARALELGKQYGDYAFAVLLITLDRIAFIRGSLGQEVASRSISLLAQRLQTCAGPDSLVCRFDDDSFTVLLEDVADASDGTRLADSIHRIVREPFTIDGQTIYTTVSIGMTSSARNYAHADEVLSDITAAASQTSGRGAERNEIFNTSMRIEAVTLLRLEMALREAVERQEFQMAYQPIVRLADRVVTGFESLIRWQHPKKGQISPAEFIPVAEDTGLIVPIGRWVFQTALLQLRQWTDEFALGPERTLTMNVNLSGRQITDPNLLSDVDAALLLTGVDPSWVRIELTESVMMDNAAMATQVLASLKARGLKIYIDDFGTGYSSLSYLHRFPVDGLKIDRSFVQQLDGTESSGSMIRAILGIAEHLGVEVVAEGIETETQANQLRQLRCTSGQGYLFGRPVGQAEAYAVVARGL